MNKTVFILLILLMGISVQSKAEKILLSLAECRRMAIANSEDIRMSDNDLRRSELDLKDANKAMLPRFDASAMGIYMLPDMDMTIAELQMRGAYMAGVNVTQPIYTGGKITAGRHLAKIGREVATLNRDKTRMEVIAEADNVYWTYHAVAQKVKLLES
ncbi:MAG: TolC family protein [Muribaculum sp.]|nr:TolC family protein [Muribaculum sp.]